jgi:hypothetical protein
MQLALETRTCVTLRESRFGRCVLLVTLLHPSADFSEI